MACSSNLALNVEKRPPNIHGIDAKSLYRTRVPTSIRKQCDDIVVNRHHEKQVAKRANRGKAIRKIRTTTLPAHEFERVKSDAKVISLEERLDNLVKEELENKKSERDEEYFRNKFKIIDDERKAKVDAAEAATKEDLTDNADKIKIRDKAFNAKYEQAEEVKHVNRLILDAKCHAVQNVQIQERAAIERQQRKDEITLEKKVVEIAKKSLEVEDAKFEAAYKERLVYAKEIQKQLNDRDNMRLIEGERILEESKIVRKVCEELKQDELRQKQEARERKLQFCEDLKKFQAMNEVFRQVQCKQQLEDDYRVAEYLRKKREHELFLREEEKVKKEEKERKRLALFELAQKTLDSIQDREEMSYVRDQERTEREWRKRERDAVLKKQQVAKDLQQARITQLLERKNIKSAEIRREEYEFRLLEEKLTKAEEKQKKMDIERICARKSYREAIINQMNDNELERRRLVDLERAQAFEWRESLRQRDINVRTVIDNKLKAMREACLPERYVIDIENKIKNIIK